MFADVCGNIPPHRSSTRGCVRKHSTTSLIYSRMCAETFHHIAHLLADVAELADALVSGSSEAIHVGSSPVIRTKNPSI